MIDIPEKLAQMNGILDSVEKNVETRMIKLQFAKAECSNYDQQNGSCKGIGIKDDGTLFMFGRKPACVLGNRIPCCYFEECVLPMGIELSNARNVHAGTVANSIPIALDNWTFTYGDPVTAGSLWAGTAANAKQILVPIPPVIIAPGWTYTLSFWGASWSANALTLNTEVGWIERPTGQ